MIVSVPLPDPITYPKLITVTRPFATVNEKLRPCDVVPCHTPAATVEPPVPPVPPVPVVPAVFVAVTSAVIDISRV